MAVRPSTPGGRAFVLTVIVFSWSVALVVAALVVPGYGSATLVDENGRSVLLVVPVLTCAMRRRCGWPCGGAAREAAC